MNFLRRCTAFFLLLVSIGALSFSSFSLAEKRAFAADQGIELLAPFPGSPTGNVITTHDKNSIQILGAYVSQVFTFGLALIVIFAVLMIMVAGYEYMFAGGDTSKSDNAKSRIFQSLLGLALAFLAALFLNIINPNFYKL